MNKFLPRGAKTSPSPELQETIKLKKQEVKTLKKDLRAARGTDRNAIEAKIKSTINELKVISPKVENW